MAITGPVLGRNPTAGIKFGRSKGGLRFNTDFFFDRDRVRRIIGQKSASYLGRIGALVRAVSRNSIRYRKYGNTSTPGSPPFTHLRGTQGGKLGLNIKMIQFYLDPKSLKVIIGPLGVSSHGVGNTVPEALEYGGHAVIGTPYRNGRRTKKVVRIRKRPFMNPALHKTKSKYAELWKKALK